MRRPNICGSSMSIADQEVYKPTRPLNIKESGGGSSRVSLVRRMLGGSRGNSNKKKDSNNLSPSNVSNNTNSNLLTNSGGGCGHRHFGVPLADLPLIKCALPKILHRFCTYLEANGMGHGSLFKGSSGDSTLVESLKREMDTEGEAELEELDNPVAVASLLKIWLNELPEPIFDKEATGELIAVIKKYEGDPLWGRAVRDSVLSLGQVVANSACLILRLLHAYTERHPHTMSYIPSVFTPLLTYVDSNSSRQETVQLVGKLIESYDIVFHQSVHQSKDSQILKVNSEGNNLKQAALVISEIAQSQKQRKRKERHDSGSKNDPKFVRSNSEERPALKTACNDMRAETMRRVSSHEDFSKSRVPPQSCTAKAHTPQQTRKIVQPLHERNTRSPERDHAAAEKSHSVITYRPGLVSDVFDESEHEARRQGERFAPHTRNLAGRRRRRTKHRYHPTTAKENEIVSPENVDVDDGVVIECDTVIIDTDDSLPPLDVDAVDPDSATPVTSSSEQSLKLDDLTEEECNKCPSPISGFYSPTLDLKAKQEQTLCAEPISSAPVWSPIPPSDERMVSPRNSLFMSRRVYTNPSTDEVNILDLNAQIHNLKQKIKKFEEGFEREFGAKPSQADKLANSEVRKMMSLLSKLRKQARYKKDEARIANMEKNNTQKPEITDDIVLEIEKRLKEKRVTSGRCDTLDDMSQSQLVDEKCAMQKALLQLEHTYGRPQSRKDRDTVRPLYDRYREVKRSLMKHTPSKMKESVSELGTILEHETMEFPGQPPSPPRTPSPPAVQQPSERKAIAQTVVLDNLHALPHNELLELQKATREEKKRLKRSLREYEMQQMPSVPGRLAASVNRRFSPSSSNQPNAESTLYSDYKQAKAKLKFIDALINKLRK